MVKYKCRIDFGCATPLFSIIGLFKKLIWVIRLIFFIRSVKQFNKYHHPKKPKGGCTTTDFTKEKGLMLVTFLFTSLRIIHQVFLVKFTNLVDWYMAESDLRCGVCIYGSVCFLNFVSKAICGVEGDMKIMGGGGRWTPDILVEYDVSGDWGACLYRGDISCGWGPLHQNIRELGIEKGW